jgi:release factor glutamine methyltransferase
MTVLEVIQRSAEFLARKGVDSPRLQVELLLASVLKIPRLRLYLDFERKLTEAELEETRQLLKRRANREPLQHILGSTSFCGLEIAVNSSVLVPRPETETLAERAWQWLGQRVTASENSLAALDFGTGSGCIALALAHHLPQLSVTALDLSAESLALAQKNADRLGLVGRITFLQGEGFQPLAAGTAFDLIVSNPPYIPTAEIDQLEPEVRDYDPRLALDGGPDGLRILRVLACEGGQHLRPGGALMTEFGDGQAPAVPALFEEHGWTVDEIVNDLAGRERILIAHPIESWNTAEPKC